MKNYDSILERLKNDSITSLDLSFENLDVNSIKPLAEALKTNMSLTQLNLQNNNAGGNGAKAIAEALKTNKTLTDLNLYGNNIGDEGAIHIAEALVSNQTLVKLNLSWNDIKDEGIHSIAEALKTNKVLTGLIMVNTSMKENGESLAHLMKRKIPLKLGRDKKLSREASDEDEIVFKTDMLADFFEAGKWTGRTEQMQRQWENVPFLVKRDFDFSAALNCARLETLRERAPKRPLIKKSRASEQKLIA